MIKAIVFDWGGVLIDNPADGLMVYCAEDIGVSVGALKEEWVKFENEFQRGLIQEGKMWEIICDKLGVDVPKANSLWKEAVRSIFTNKEEVFGLVNRLRENGLKLGFLSNTEIPTMKYFFEKGYDKYFDETVFSCAEKCIKPEERIYRILLEKLGTKPEETIFIDDKQSYVDGATKAGIGGILFLNYEDLVDKLKVYGVKI